VILRATLKVQDKIKLAAPDKSVQETPAKFLEEWYVNLFSVERKSYYIFTEVTTLFSVVQSSNGINSRQMFEGLATDILFSVFKIHGDKLPISLFESIAQTITIQKTNNRKVIGSQNELIFMALAFPEDFDRINETPMSMLGNSPDRAFLKAIDALS